MMASVEVSTIAAWLLTYLVHSTLLLGSVALLTRYVVRRESLREALWKAALVGGLVSATLAVAVPRPSAARIDMAALGVSAVMAAGEEDQPAGGLGPRYDREAVTTGGDLADRGVGPGLPGANAARELDTDRETDLDGDTDHRREGEGVGAAAGGGSTGSTGAADWIGVLVAGWALIAGLLMGRLVYRHARLRLLLRDRTQVPGTERAASMLTELRRTAGVWKPVRLTSTPAVATPLALGGAEVCVPERFLSELDVEAQRAALAHELAHLKRRDPFWQLAGSVLAAAFFFQPLNGTARRGIRSAAEYLADGWAVAQTGSRMELARCLAAVAGWAAPSSEPALAGTVAMAEGGSPLLTRVQRLLEHEPEPALRPALRAAAAVALIVAAAALAPAVGPAGQAAAAPVPAGLTGPAADTTQPQEPLKLHRFDRPGVEGDGFVARLNEAGRDARQSPYWVAYAIPTRGAAQRLVMDSDPWNSRELDEAPLAATLGVTDELAGGPDQAVVLVRLVPRGGATRVDRITVRRPELGMRLSGAVYWLGQPDPGPSFRWFRDIYQAVDDRRIREAAVEAMSVHDVPEAQPFLQRVLGEDRDPDVRAEAIEGLGLRPDTALVRLFFELAMSDPMEEIRHEATEQLGRTGQPMAVALLERLAWEATDPDVQRQAAESLGEAAESGAGEVRDALARLVESHPSMAVRREALDQMEEIEGALDGNALLAMAFRSDAPELRREAVELMARLPSDQAVALLRRAVFESGDGTVERQATETLGEVGTPAAFEVLLDILDRNPSEDASFQAVESITENFPRDIVIETLRRVISSHPSSRVRREALDELGDLGG